MNSQEELKKLTGYYALQFVEEGMVIGMGTGSTAYWFIQALGEKVKSGFSCVGVPTSTVSEDLARKANIPIRTLNEVSKVDVTIDGADEIDSQLRLIKGGGGALLQEKMVAAASRKMIVIADESKLVDELGTFALPVEVIPYGWKQVQARIKDLFSITVQIRKKEDTFYVTDHGHYILDCYFEKITDPSATNACLHNIPGVVETGLFIKLASFALIGKSDGSIQKIDGVPDRASC